MASPSRGQVLVCAGVLVVLAAGGGVAYAMSGGSGTSYRLATATTATVQQSVTETGTVNSVDQANVAFPVAGQVATVPVSVGQAVSAGQTVATLDRTSLDQTLESAQSDVASAQQTLADDEAAQSAGTSTDSASERSLTSSAATETAASTATETAATTGTATPSGAPSQPGGGTRKGSGSGGSLTALQNAVTSAQQQLDAAIGTVDGDVRTAVTDCRTGSGTPVTVTVPADASGTVTGQAGSSGSPVTVTLEDSSGDPVSSTTSSNPQTGVTGQYSFAGLTAGDSYQVAVTQPGAIVDASSCAAAVKQTSDDQKVVDQKQNALKQALKALDAAIGASGTGSGSTGSTGGSKGSGSTGTGGQTGSRTGTGTTRTGTSTGTGSGSTSRTGGTGTGGTGTGGTGAGGTGSGQSKVITAEQLAADQKAVDAADADVTVATQAMNSATLVTPIAGTVAAVSISAGQQVSAGSTSSVITVIGHGQHAVATTIGIADVDLVKRGTPATVTVDGVSAPLTGTVSYIGSLNTSGTSGSTTTYPLTVVLDQTSLPLFDGAGASVALDVGAAKNALTVPTSAVHTLGSLHTVTVYSGGSVSTARVTIGVQGLDRTQILSGLKAGQQVVLADVSAAVPSSSSTTQTGRFALRGAGGLTGGGGLGGGLGGGVGGGGLGGALGGGGR